jgi:uncharacterized protein
MQRIKNKKKIINDPVYGFIEIKFDLIYDLIEHPYFQRLRRIKQLGLTHYVYPGANHTRFQHALGAMHLMGQAIEVIKNKGAQISPEEELAVTAAILLHDVGHGPFSHALEHTIIEKASHEKMSLYIMEELDEEFEGQLQDTITIFKGLYPKKFLHELVSGQLDMDRLDYLKRDSFFTGVYEGVIGEDRIIKMLNVVGDKLVSEHKGIYSVERFLTARRLMYWQVYFHKAVIASEKLLENLLLRAKDLAKLGEKLFATPDLHYFLYHYDYDMGYKPDRSKVIDHFIKLDDSDIITSAKAWSCHKDPILSLLSKNLLNRRLGNVHIYEKGDIAATDDEIYDKTIKKYKLNSHEELKYFINKEKISNHTYATSAENIRVLMNNGQLKDLNEVSDVINLGGLTQITEKYFICYPKDLSEY